MYKKYLSRPGLLKTLFLSLLLIVSCVVAAELVQIAAAGSSFTGVAKPIEFYFHHVENPVTVAGLQTKYVMNTTRQFSYLTQQEAMENSLFKAVGLPKIEVDFYLYPNLAGPVAIDGSWQVYLWVNGSAYKPTGFTLRFMEITAGGNTLWDSGTINPTVTSSLGSYIDVPVYNYNLSASLSHSFSAGSTIFVGVEVNSGSSADTRIWYDSELYPSKIILPAKDYARPAQVKTYAYDNSETTLFHYNWTEAQRVVTIRANVTDPFGGYDIQRVGMTILDPAGNSVVNDMSMKRVSNGQWEIGFSHLFEANYTYPANAQRGNYTVTVSVVDDNGYYRNLQTGSPEPFTESYTHFFSIGEILYVDPAFQFVDDVGDPLPNAQVYVKWPNGSRDILPRYGSETGFINFTDVPVANYEFTVLWKDVLVKQTVVDVNSNGPYIIKTEVYQLIAEVLGNDGTAVNGAYVIANTQSGVGYGFSITDETGQAIFKLPKGTYDIETHYRGEYWLTFVTASANTTGIQVDSSKLTTVSVEAFPPPIWSTVGFWLILIPILIILVSVVYKKVLQPRGSWSKK